MPCTFIPRGRQFNWNESTAPPGFEIDRLGTVSGAILPALPLRQQNFSVILYGHFSHTNSYKNFGNSSFFVRITKTLENSNFEVPECITPVYNYTQYLITCPDGSPKQHYLIGAFWGFLIIKFVQIFCYSKALSQIGYTGSNPDAAKKNNKNDCKVKKQNSATTRVRTCGAEGNICRTSLYRCTAQAISLVWNLIWPVQS